MTRNRYLVCYDVADPRRLRRVARTMESFGRRLQYSIFECALDDLRLAECRLELHPILNHDEDQVLFVSLGPNARDATLAIETLGKPYTPRTRVTII